MTHAGALAEARRRWGNNGEPAARSRPGFASVVFEVGVYEFGSGRRIFYENGRGSSWEAAFADADRRDAKKGGGA